MSELITTLHKKEDSTVDVYPNIKSDNVPAKAITKAKLEQTIQDQLTILDNVMDSTGNIATSNITATSITSDTYLDNENDELKVLKSHCIYCELVDTNLTDKQFRFNFLSTYKDAITSLDTLSEILNYKKGLPIFDLSSKVMGVLTNVNAINHTLTILCDDSGVMTELTYDSQNFIYDNVYPA